MMRDEILDFVLREYETMPPHWDQQTHLLQKLEAKYSTEIAVQELGVILAILENDGNIEQAIHFAGDSIFNKAITVKGRAFINTTSYVMESRKRELERAINEKSIAKMEMELRLNRWYLKSKWLPHIIAFLSLIVAIIALVISMDKAIK